LVEFDSAKVRQILGNFVNLLTTILELETQSGR